MKLFSSYADITIFSVAFPAGKRQAESGHLTWHQRVSIHYLTEQNSLQMPSGQSSETLSTEVPAHSSKLLTIEVYFAKE